MKILVLLFSLLFVSPPASVYDFKLKTIDGVNFSLAQYKGKKILIVNTASFCGNTPQYADLEKLSQLYKDKLVVIAFPANNFGKQEPGTNQEIKTFCRDGQYHITFPIAEKVSVKGDDMAPLFQYLTQAPNPDFTGDIDWNFSKFLIDENGKLIHRYRSAVKPLDPSITNNL